MKVYCGQCKFYKYVSDATNVFRMSCTVQENWKDTFEMPNSKLIDTPINKNKENNCTTFMRNKQYEKLDYVR